MTSSRDALNGYQKGKCFYCFASYGQSGSDCHVDHFFPHSAKQYVPFAVLDGVWNLVLACTSGNLRKSNQRPARLYLQRLNRGNEFLISSNHPLRETLMLQTGATRDRREKFLRDV